MAGCGSIRQRAAPPKPSSRSVINVAMPCPRVARKVGFAFFEAIDRPRLVAAPMVDQSELPFRLLMRRGTSTARHERPLL